MAGQNNAIASSLQNLTETMRNKKKDTMIAENNELNQQLTQEQIVQQKYKSLDTRQQSRLKSVVLGAAELDTYLKTDNIDGAKNYLLRRKAELASRAANGEDVDTFETDQALQMLNEDPEALRDQLGGAIDMGRNLGFFETQSNKGGATGELVDRIMQENPNMSFGDALAQVQTGYRKGVTFENGTAKPIDGFGDAVGSNNFKENKGSQDGKNTSDLGYKPEIETATLKAKAKEEGFQKLPLIQRSLQSKELKDEFLDKKITEIQSRANPWSTGFTGSLASAVKGTDAFDLKADIETLLANAGFDTLQEMRDNSPTGGALGQVSEREISLLQASQQNLMQSQSYEQFQRNLADFKETRRRGLENMRNAYEQDYKRYGGENDEFLPTPQQTSGNQSSEISLDEFLGE